MRKKRVILLCLVGAALALTVPLAYNPTHREPSCAGHPLNYWVEMLGSHAPTVPFIGFAAEAPDFRNEMATNAINSIGVPALPFLLKWIQYEPGPWKLTLFNRLARTPSPPARMLSNWIIDPKALQLASGSCLAFEVLGTRALPAFDELCRLMNDTNRPVTASRAALALGYFGTNALPQLEAVARNANHPARIPAGIAIVQIQNETTRAMFISAPAP